MGTLTIKLSASLEARLDSLVRRRGQCKSVLVREAIERLVHENGQANGGGALELVEDLVGIYDGPRDLSGNKKHMRGYGR